MAVKISMLEAIQTALADRETFRAYFPTKIVSDGVDNHCDKFGGRPSTSIIEEWPCCGVCGDFMTFIFQLTDPKEGSTIGTVQLFLCKNYKCANASTEYSHVRFIQYDNDTMCLLDHPDGGSRILPCQQVTGWTTTDEYRPTGGYYDPLCPEAMQHRHEDRILMNPEVHDPGFFDGISDELHVDYETKKKYHNDLLWNAMCPSSIIKFHGVAPTCQQYTYPGSIIHLSTCVECPFMWGDAGYAHIFSNGHIEYDSS